MRLTDISSSDSDREVNIQVTAKQLVVHSFSQLLSFTLESTAC